ncbi:uncharacterized protein PV09_08876 [Verruconis gallopava]|uniref:Transmembrane protein n=1 Tax=Verruconis gallopava TaxID=253628 RepID=A0A0D1ZYC3_9PEZI|nr:uncharacterized protein PV09_08876 [Verruconis gallopava]KIV99447.1 hypothetical protein PV09_08876 [Verruconis gallopava]
MRPRARIASAIKPASKKLELGQELVRWLVARDDDDDDASSSSLARQQAVTTTTAVTTVMSQTTMVVFQTLSAAPTPLPQASQVSALPDKGDTSMSSVASPTIGSYIGTKRPLSETTQHILIIAGSVAVTMAMMLLGFYIWRRRTNRRKLSRSVSSKSFEKEPYVTAPLGSNWGTYKWDPKSTFAPAASYKEILVPSPEPTYVRPGTSQSNRAVPTRAPFAPPNKRATPNLTPVYVVPTPAPRTPPQRQIAVESRAPSPELPLQRPETRPSSPSRTSSLPQYLAQMRDAPEATNATPPPPKTSRFSWTNSQAPKTPNDPNDRYSVVSEAESVPRYRTVESWVGNQAGRYEERRIQERIQFQLDEAIGELSKDRSAGVPPLPTDGRQPQPVGRAPLKTIPLQDSSSVFVDGVDDEEADQVTDLSLIPEAARKTPVSRAGSRKARRKTNESDMTIFRAHPGTKVDIPDSRFIPSEILDDHLGSRAYPPARDSYA